MKEKVEIKKIFLKYHETVKNLILLRSLKARLFLIILLVGIVPGIFMRYGIVDNYEEKAVERRITEVSNELMIIGKHLIANNYLGDYMSEETSAINSRRVIDAELEILSNLYDGRIMVINKNLKVITDTYELSEGKTIISEEVIKCFLGMNATHYDPEHGYIELTTPIVNTVAVPNTENGTTESRIEGVMLTSISTAGIMAMMKGLHRNALLVEMVMSIVILALAMILANVLTRPLERVTKAINEVKAGYSNESISVPDYVETIHIVDAFNQLLKRMKALDDSRQEFVANVSHELKTPMTSMKVLADSLVAQPDVPAELYREFMEDIVSEIDRENRIITDLLALVKMDKTAQEVNITAVNINDLTEMILKRLRPLARKKEVEIVFESIRPVVAEVDEVKMSLVMTNLVENAIKYNVAGGSVHARIVTEDDQIMLEVRDTGIGIPREEIPKVFNRFYRVDKARSRAQGGTGLGLAIVRDCVRRYGGWVSASANSPQGSVFTVGFPRYEQEEQV